MVKYYFIIFSLLFVLDVLASSGEEENKVVTRDRQTYTDAEKDRIKAQFREAVIKSILLGTQTALENAPVVGAAFQWIYKMISENIGADSEWDKMERRIERKIRTTVTDKHINDLKGVWDRINYRLRKAERGIVDKTDFADIRSYYHRFFPQNYVNEIEYSYKWPINMIRYLTALNAMYVEYMINDELDKCAWAEKLKIIKPDILMAVKALAKVRYRSLEKVSYFGGKIKWNYARLQYKDTPTGTLLDDDGLLISNVEQEVIRHLERKTKDDLLESLVAKFNVMFNKTWAPDSCSPPSPISDHNVRSRASFPRSCMGRGTGSEREECTYPCGRYTKDYLWCTYMKHHDVSYSDDMWRTTRDNGRGGTEVVVGWTYCNEPNWDTCIRTEGTKLHEWSDDDFKKEKKEEN